MKDDGVYLAHMRDALHRVRAYTVDGRNAFMADPKTQDAVLRSFEVVGEAAKRVSASTRDRAPSVPWRSVAGLRDKLIHHYFGVNLEIVWNVVERDVPALVVEIERLLQAAEAS